MTNPSRCDIIIMSRGEHPYIIKTKERKTMAIVMKEISPRSKKHLKFKDLSIGDIFTEDSGLWWLKIDKIYAECGEVNAVSLNGDTALVSDEESVRRLNKDLTIEVSSDDLIEWI